MRFAKPPLHTLLCVGACALLLAGCATPDTDANLRSSPADRVPPNVNITCQHFTKLSPKDQQAASDKLMRSYQQAKELASEQAGARRDFGLKEGTEDHAEAVSLESPSFLNLARHTCALPANKDVRLLTAMGFS